MREHGQMLISKSDTTFIDTLLDVLANLMGITTINHIKLGPTILTFSTRGSTNKEIKLHFTLKVVLFDMISQSNRNHLGVTNTSEARPTDISIIQNIRHTDTRITISIKSNLLSALYYMKK